MDLNVLIILFVVCFVAVELFTKKKEKRTIKIKRVYNNFGSDCFTYLVLSFLVSCSFHYFLNAGGLLDLEVNSAKWTIISLTMLGFQIINIYNFYESLVYSYRYLKFFGNWMERLFLLVIGLIVILVNEFLLSNSGIITVVYQFKLLNFVPYLVIYSTYLFLPVLVFIRIINSFFNKK